MLTAMIGTDKTSTWPAAYTSSLCEKARKTKRRSPLHLFKKMKNSSRNRSSSCPETMINSLEPNGTLCPPQWQTDPHEDDSFLSSQDSYEETHHPKMTAKECRKKKWHRRLLNFKEEVEKAYSRFVNSVPSLREGCETIKARLSPSRDLETANSRTLRVELQSHNVKKRSHAKSLENVLGDDLNDDEGFSPVCHCSLIVKSLADGKFDGFITMQHLPSDGDIIIRISDSKLEFFLHKRPIASKDNHHTIHRPYKVADLDLPIFIDSTSLQFSLEDDRTISIEGSTKNFLSRRLSVSSEDMRMRLKHPKFHRKFHSPLTGKSPMVKRKISPRKTIWYTEDTPDGAPSKDETYRDRAYTR